MGDNKGWNWGEVRHRQLGRKKCWLMTGERYKERATEESSLSQQLLQCENPLKVNFPSSASCQYPCDQNLCRPAICFPFTLHCYTPPPGLDLHQGTLGSANLWIWMYGGWGWQGIFFFIRIHALRGIVTPLATPEWQHLDQQITFSIFQNLNLTTMI